MRFLKKNFVVILLIISSIGMGVLAFATALKLWEFRQTPPQTQALTPTCKLTFTIEDTTPRQELVQAPSITISPSQVTVTLALTPKPSVKPTTAITPTPTTAIRLTSTPAPSVLPTVTSGIGALRIPTATVTPQRSSSPTPTVSLLAQTRTTLTPTPRLTTSPTPTVKAATPTTTVIQPQLPVSGMSLPTTGAFLLGIIIIGIGIFFKKSPVTPKQ